MHEWMCVCVSVRALFCITSIKRKTIPFIHNEYTCIYIFICLQTLNGMKWHTIVVVLLLLSSTMIDSRFGFCVCIVFFCFVFCSNSYSFAI